MHREDLLNTTQLKMCWWNIHSLKEEDEGKNGMIDLMPKIIMQAELEAKTSVHIYKSIKEISLNGKITILDISNNTW